MGKSHYIQVKELVLDAIEPSVLGPLCEAEGYIDPTDTEVLDPYCIAQGYIVDPDSPIPPAVEIPENNTDEKIILIVSSELDSAISFRTNISNTGQSTVLVSDMSDNQISTTNVNNATVTNLDFDANDGTAHPDGYSLFKVTITPTIGTNSIIGWANMTRTYYAINGWPLKEAHFYTPNIEDLASAFATRCKKLEYLKFYTACDSLTIMSSLCNNCRALRECYLPETMNSLENASGAFNYCQALKIVDWPVSLPACITFSDMYKYGGLTKVTSTTNALPDLPVCTNMRSMFEYNYVIEQVEINGDFPLMELCTNFCLWCTKLTSLKFNGTMGGPTAYTNMDWVIGYNYDNLREFKWPTTAYLTESSQATQAKQCYILETVTMPETLYYTSGGHKSNFLSSYDDDVSLSVMTTINNVTQDYCHRLFLIDAKNLSEFDQPGLKLYGAQISGGSFSLPHKLSKFNCDWAAIEVDNFYAGTISFYFRYCSLDQVEIDRIFTALPTLTGSGTIDVRNTPGYATCDPSIATAKGWTVT